MASYFYSFFVNVFRRLQTHKQHAAIVEHMHIHGFLFLNYEGNRLLFVGDGLELEDSVDWQRLLSTDCLERFVAEFQSHPTREGPLKGWRVDADSHDIMSWLDRNCVVELANSNGAATTNELTDENTAVAG